MQIPMYQQLKLPKSYLRTIAESSKPTIPKANDIYDTGIFIGSLFVREFLSTFCLLVLNSRLGKDNFIAGPIVTMYVNLFFRRPINNPFVLTMACLSSSDWGKANVVGYPGLTKDTSKWHIYFFWLLMLTAQLVGAVTAAYLRAANDSRFGSEFIDGAAWGTGQLMLRANVADSNTCWNADNTLYIPGDIQNIPVRLTNNNMIKNTCYGYMQGMWWFSEDMVAVLFLIVGYVHIWRWLRWQDMVDKSASEKDSRYWSNIIVFSAASASLGLMNTMTFPTAHTGAHTSLFLGVYQILKPEKVVTANFMGEPWFRAGGGLVGCMLGVVYEKAITYVNDSLNTDDSFAAFMHKVLYISRISDRPTSNDT